MPTADAPGFALAPLFAHTDRLVLATPASSTPLPALVAAQRTALDELVERTGGILFRGFEVDETAFADTVAALCEPLFYVYRSTPRTAVGAGVYTATEYPANQ